MIRRSLLRPFLLPAVLVAAFGASGCQTTRNFTTYYNLFYNMERIMDQAEEELLYIREQKSPEPTLHVAYDDALLRGAKTYNHLDRRSMSVEEARANKVKLDSIIIKGSKLLTRAAESDYVDDAVYYMSRSFFYQRDWFQSQKKAEELIANFPESKWLPDAHLVLAMDLLQQGQPDRALTMISRAIDIGWAMERLDVLIDAFRLNADIHLAEGRVDEALRPFERAIALSTDGADRARWQYEIGVVHFRAEQFDKAIAAFENVGEYSPDVITEFQAGLQRAATLRALGRGAEAAEILEDLRDNGNYEEWRGLVDVELLNVAAAARNGTIDDSTLAAIDSAAPGKAFAAYGIYERGVRAFRAGEFESALSSFQKVQSMPVSFQRKAQRFVSLLTQYYEHQHRIIKYHTHPFQPYPDSIKAGISDTYYNLARLFTTLQRPDSVEKYYDSSLTWAPRGSMQGARVIYARAAVARADNRLGAADSMLETLVADYGTTEYAADARRTLGYTEAALIDSAADLYTSGMAFMRTNDPMSALRRFQSIIHLYPRSAYGPQAYYAAGYLYETVLDNRDSAFAYYSEILNLYPFSPQAETVRPIVDAVLTNRIQTGARLDGEPIQGQGVPPNTVVLTPDGVPRLEPGAEPVAVEPAPEPTDTVAPLPEGGMRVDDPKRVRTRP